MEAMDDFYWFFIAPILCGVGFASFMVAWRIFVETRDEDNTNRAKLYRQGD